MATGLSYDNESVANPIPPDGLVREPVCQGDFPHSILIPGTDVSVKVGGYGKVDLIHDFNAIGDADVFDTTTIPTNGLPGKNSRLHARQTRLNLDIRHPSALGEVKIFTEGDFFGEGNAFRLRHASVSLGPIMGGQTWSTFMDELIMPALVDFESPTGALLTRRALLRWTQPLAEIEGLEYSLAVEDPTPAFASTAGTFESALPDFVGRLRLQQDDFHMQLAGFVSQASFIPTVGSTSEALAWGGSVSSRLNVFESDKVMCQIAYGDGIQRFRGAQSYNLDAGGALVAAPAWAWYFGYEHTWTHNWRSVLAFSRATVDNPDSDSSSLKSAEYVAANLLWTPVQRIQVGLEYLYGTREDKDASRGAAHRLQFAIWYFLP